MDARSIVILLMALTIAACNPNSPPPSSGATGLRLDNVLGGQAAKGFARAERTREFVFPEDHGPHTQYQSEWWYLTAVLEDENGSEYGVHFTLFRQALSPHPTGEGPWHTAQAYLGHLAVSDISTGRHLEAERFARGHPELAGVTTGSHFSALIEDWTLAGKADGKLDLALSAGEDGLFSVSLKVRQTGPVVLQGDRGLSRKGPDAASYYYSIPRMEVSGTLHLKDSTAEVKGLGWLDREWSTSVLDESLVGWDWFSLQLQDQRSIMVFRLRRRDGERDDYDQGLLLDHDQIDNRLVLGAGDDGIDILRQDDFQLRPTRYYQDAEGINWPVSWTLSLGDERFLINALLDQQRVDLSIVYWEGLVEVLDSTGITAGRGYMELTGYGREAP